MADPVSIATLLAADAAIEIFARAMKGRDLSDEASEAAQRLDEKLDPEEREDVALVAAKIQADATVKAAQIGKTASTRAAWITLGGSVVGAFIGAGTGNWIYDVITA